MNLRERRPDLVEFSALVRQHGALVSLRLAGVLLAVGRAQIYRLWACGRFARVSVKGYRMVPLRELVAYARRVERRRASLRQGRCE